MKIKLLTTIVIFTILLSACTQTDADTNQTGGSQSSEPTQSVEPTQPLISFEDALGHNVTISEAKRVIALSGSFAQIWLLAGGELVGTTQDAFESGYVTDETVGDVGGVHSPDLESIIALDPDLVILSQTASGHVKLYDQLNDAGITTAYFTVEIFTEYLDMLKICTDITGRSDLYEANGAAVSEKINAITGKASLSSYRPTVLLIRATSTGVSARNSDTLAGAMLNDLGCLNIVSKDKNLLENLSVEAIIDADPDFIFAVTMGDDDKALAVIEDTLVNNPAWAGLSAVVNNKYYVLPKELFHQKPNNRWGESYEMLYEIIFDR
ncbi:ABC transporter substrate-binding protein [Clostridia bacterium]|nr:ABC transporter substrate-binding protein [Clostridia bacterium]